MFEKINKIHVVGIGGIGVSALAQVLHKMGKQVSGSDLEDAEISGLMAFSKKVAGGIKKATGCEKVAVVVYGLLVRHAHVHLVPVDGTPGELDFRNQKDAAASELAQMAQKIRTFV